MAAVRSPLRSTRHESRVDHEAAGMGSDNVQVIVDRFPRVRPPHDCGTVRQSCLSVLPHDVVRLVISLSLWA